MKKLFYISTLFVVVVFSSNIIARELDSLGKSDNTSFPEIFQDLQDKAIDKQIKDEFDHYLIYSSYFNSINYLLTTLNHFYQPNLPEFIQPVSIILRI